MATVGLCLALSGHVAARTGDRDAAPDARWWKEQFVLSTFASVRPGDDIEAVVGSLAEAGLTALESNTPLQYKAERLSREEHIRVLEASERSGLRYFVTDHGRMTHQTEPSREAIESLVEDFAGYPALGGYYVWDEPKPEQFEAVARMYRWLQALDPDRLPLNAMLPSYGPYKYPDDYPRYVRAFVETVDPPVLSFDFYGLVQQEDGSVAVAPRLFQDLALWSEVSVETGKPLWFYAAACQRDQMAEPTRATISFQVYTAIAYGAKGIQYFMARDFTGGPVDFTGAPLRADGTPGPLFEAFKNLNGEISSLSEAILPLTVQQVVHTAPVPPESEAFEPGMASLADAPDDLILALHHDPDGRRYLVVVNRDLSAQRDVTLEFAEALAVVRLPEGEQDPEPDRQMPLVLPAGGGALLRLD